MKEKKAEQCGVWGNRSSNNYEMEVKKHKCGQCWGHSAVLGRGTED